LSGDFGWRGAQRQQPKSLQLKIVYMIDIAFAAEMAKEATHAAEAAAPAAPSLLGTFGVNWKLFIAQLVNFGIVLLILWKWVYTPMLKVMNERTSKIEKSLEEAKQIEEERKALEQTKVDEMQKTREEAKQVIQIAKDRSEKVSDAMRVKAKEEVAGIVLQAKQQIAAERDQMKKELEAETINLAVVVAEKVLSKKITSEEDKKLLDKALKEVK